MAKKTAKKSVRKKKAKARKKKPQFFETLSAKQLYLALGIIVAVTLLALSPLLTADFVDIDDNKLVQNRVAKYMDGRMHLWKMEYGRPYYKPLTYATWILENKLTNGGQNPTLYHVNNVLLHLLNTLMVFFLARSIVPKFDKLDAHKIPIAFFTALLFGVHPMHVESVGWVTERKDVLFTFFYLIGLLGYVRYLEKNNKIALAISAVAYLCSMLSKIPGITMLAVLFLFDFVWRRKLSVKLFVEKSLHIAAFVWALFMFGIISRRTGEGSVRSFTVEKKIAKASNVSEQRGLYGRVLLSSMRTVLWYLHSLFPVKLALGYPREAVIGFFGPFIHVMPALMAAAGAALLWFRNSRRLLFFAHVFFFITLSPAAARLGLGIGIFMSDRYAYLPILGLVFLFVAWIYRLQEKGKFTLKVKHGILAAVSLLFAIGSFNMSRTWENAETLWTNVINKYPTVDYAFVNRGSYYREIKEYDKAYADLNRSIGVDENANALIQRGIVLRQQGKPAEALKDYNRAIALEEDNTQARTNRGNAYLDLGRFQKAIVDYDYVLKEERHNNKTRVNRAIAHASMRNFDKAAADFARAEKLAPNYKELYVNRAIMYFESQRYALAAQDYEKFLQFVPNDHQVMNDLGITHQALRKHQDAVTWFGRAIALNPERDYYLSRARSYDALGNAQAAAQDRKLAN